MSKNVKQGKNKQVEPSPSEILTQKILSVTQNKGYVLPSKQSISILLSNEKYLKLFSFAVDKINAYHNNKSIKKSIQFYNLYQDKIKAFLEKGKKKEMLMKKLQQQQNLLLQIKQNRLKYQKENNEINNKVNLKEKEEILSSIKSKIISSSMPQISEIIKKIDNFSFITNFKYDHCYFGSVNHKADVMDVNEVPENFDMNKYLHENMSHLSLYHNASSMLAESNLTKTSKKSPIVPLPKLTKEDIRNFTPLKQEKFFNEVLNLLSNLDLKKLYEDNSLALSISSFTNNENSNKLLITESFNKIIAENLSKIQKDEKLVSIDYQKASENDSYVSELKVENTKLINAYHIPEEDVKKINIIVRKRLAKELLASYVPFNEEIEEFILPHCVIDDDAGEKITYYLDVIKTYAKIKARTDNFTIKCFFPLGVTLEEKYTDFINTINTEFDYFLKLHINYLNKQRGQYSFKSMKYDRGLLSSLNVSNKYDVFSYFIRYKKRLMKNGEASAKEKFAKESIYKNEDFIQYSNNKSVLITAKNFISSFDFNEEYKLVSDVSEIDFINEIVNEFSNIKYMTYISDKY